MLPGIQRSEIEDPAFDEYISACESYYRRQMLIYEHAPRNAYGSSPDDPELRFVDRNA